MIEGARNHPSVIIWSLANESSFEKTYAFRAEYRYVKDVDRTRQHALPRSVVYYGQDTLKDGGTRYDELGVFLPLEHFADRLERHVETATKIVYGE